MATLPPGVTYGYAAGQFIFAEGDTSSDEDRLPDAVPAKGTVVFSPVDPRIEAGPALHVGKKAVSTTLDPDGKIIDRAGAPGVWLVTGRYTATISLTGLSPMTASFEITDEHTLESPLYVPGQIGVSLPPGFKFVFTEQVWHDTTAARDATFVARDEILALLDDLEGGLPGDGEGAVSSVNGKVGVIVLTPEDIGAATAAQGAKADSAVQPGSLGAYVPTTRTVAGKPLSENVSLVKGDVGLSNVDNTSDSAKPVSTATQTALDAKADDGHTHVIEDVDELRSWLDGKAGAAHFHEIPDINGLQDALDAKADRSDLVVLGVLDAGETPPSEGIWLRRAG